MPTDMTPLDQYLFIREIGTLAHARRSDRSDGKSGEQQLPRPNTVVTHGNVLQSETFPAKKKNLQNIFLIVFLSFNAFKVQLQTLLSQSKRGTFCLRSTLSLT